MARARAMQGGGARHVGRTPERTAVARAAVKGRQPLVIFDTRSPHDVLPPVAGPANPPLEGSSRVRVEHQPRQAPTPRAKGGVTTAPRPTRRPPRPPPRSSVKRRVRGPK